MKNSKEGERSSPAAWKRELIGVITRFLVLELGQDPGPVKGQYSPRFSPAIGSIASLLLGVYVELCDEEDERPPVELLVKCIFVRRALDPPSPRPGWNILRTCRTLLDSSWARRTVKEKCGRVAQIVFVFFSSIHLFWRSHEDMDMSHVCTGVWRSRKDIKSLGALCSSVRWAVKSSVTWLGSPPGNAAHMGQIWNKERRECDRHFIISGTTKHELIEKVSRRFINEEIKNCKSNIYWHTATWTLQHLSCAWQKFWKKKLCHPRLLLNDVGNLAATQLQQHCKMEWHVTTFSCTHNPQMKFVLSQHKTSLLVSRLRARDVHWN